MIPFPSVSLPDSVIPCCIFQRKPWTELFSSLMLLLNEMLFIQNICWLFQRVFVLNTWFSLCLYLMDQEPCHLRFSFQWHKPIVIELGIFLTKKPGTWGRGGTFPPQLGSATELYPLMMLGLLHWGGETLVDNNPSAWGAPVSKTNNVFWFT